MVFYFRRVAAFIMILGIPMISGGCRATPLQNHPQLREQLLQSERESPPEVQKEIQILRTSNDAVSRANAALTLSRMHEKAQGAILALIDSLTDTSTVRELPSGGEASVGDEAVTALVGIGKPAVNPLIQVVNAPANSFERKHAMSALGMIGDKSATPALIDALKDSDADVREDAATALRTAGDRSAAPSLIQALRDSNPRVRKYAVEALRTIGDKSAVQPLIQALNDSDLYVRLETMWALGTIADQAAIQPLIGTLKDSNPNVRSNAASWLGEFGDKSAVDPLIQTLHDSDPDVRNAAMIALERITHQSFHIDADDIQSRMIERLRKRRQEEQEKMKTP